ncbi:probable periplasmic protein NMA1084 [uncultured Candidatus Thioglobus sp.]|nr:probable periplasmic protein NMA1084 [uncultured Candidatus Thioglobus sp.]
MFKVFFVFLCIAFQNSLAELPLTIENVITNKGKFKLDLSLSYNNLELQGVQASDGILIQIGPTSFVNVLSKVVQTQINSDVLITSIGARYGLNDNLESYLRANYLNISSRITDLSGTSSTSDSKLADVWAGVNYQFSKDTDTPALLGSIETALYEKHTTENAKFKSHQIGITTYRAIDPIVLSLTSGYRFNQIRKDNSTNYKPGNFFFISPSVGFAVNDTITLNTGFQWLNKQPDKIGDITQGARSTTTDLILGMGYGQAKNSIINTTLKANISGRGGAGLRVNWLYSF